MSATNKLEIVLFAWAFVLGAANPFFRNKLMRNTMLALLVADSALWVLV